MLISRCGTLKITLRISVNLLKDTRVGGVETELFLYHVFGNKRNACPVLLSSFLKHKGPAGVHFDWIDFTAIRCFGFNKVRRRKTKGNCYTERTRFDVEHLHREAKHCFQQAMLHLPNAPGIQLLAADFEQVNILKWRANIRHPLDG